MRRIREKEPLTLEQKALLEKSFKKSVVKAADVQLESEPFFTLHTLH